MIAVATAAIATDGIDPAVLVPLTCLLVGLVLGGLLGVAVRAREVARLERRIAWLADCLDKACGVTPDSLTDGPRVCITVEVPD